MFYVLSRGKSKNLSKRPHMVRITEVIGAWGSCPDLYELFCPAMNPTIPPTQKAKNRP